METGEQDGVHMTARDPRLHEEPAYGISEAVVYLKIPYTTFRCWLGMSKLPPIIQPACSDPVRLSFMNLLESHALAGMRKLYSLQLPTVRSALRKIGEEDPRQPHPLVTQVFLTDRKDLFIERMGHLLNVSATWMQLNLDFYRMYLERVETDPKGLFRFFPFVVEPRSSEPKTIEINPMIGFGKPVIAGTGVSTAIIASRFNARESIAALAEEYGRTPQEIEEAIRWERALPLPVAA
jgi:uncharacterized protein (DUF433 family)